eukprot:3461785-Prymnesium_polylepis.1
MQTVGGADIAAPSSMVDPSDDVGEGGTKTAKQCSGARVLARSCVPCSSSSSSSCPSRVSARVPCSRGSYRSPVAHTSRTNTDR